jgi:hypothetical protein
MGWNIGAGTSAEATGLRSVLRLVQRETTHVKLVGHIDIEAEK